MSNLEGNAYAAPEADLTVAGNENNISQLPRISAWLVLLFAIITFGIYPAYWLYSRVKAVNEIHHNPINLQLVQALIATLIGIFVIGFISGATQSDLSSVINILNLIHYVLFLIVVYSLRNRLHGIFAANNHDAKIGPILTFFFSIIYLQYKINEAIDAKS